MTLLDVLLVSPWHTGAGASGVVSACRHLVQGLALHPDAGRVVVLSLGAERRVESLWDGAVRVETIPRQTRLALATAGWPDYVRASRWVSATGFRPGVVHGQGLAVEGLLATRLARRLSVPAVVTVHGMVDARSGFSREAARAGLARRVMNETLARAAGIVFVSPFRKEELVGERTIETRVIPNAIAPEAFEVTRRSGANVILYAGVITPNKRLLDVVRALAAVRREVPDAALRVAGPRFDEAYAQKVDEAVEELGLGDAVTLLGPLDAVSLRAEYARAGVLALASEQENAPQVVAEAMAAGLPVVASAVGGVPWMIEDGVNGYLFSPRDVDALAERIVGVLSGDSTDLAAKARAEARRFAPAHVAAETVDLYRALVGARR